MTRRDKANIILIETFLESLNAESITPALSMKLQCWKDDIDYVCILAAPRYESQYEKWVRNDDFVIIDRHDPEMTNQYLGRMVLVGWNRSECFEIEE